mmetsp:Transcript_92929/g.258827  ORF Transcript_92929/g.258827 Transcript_92929/m.258827 type:complete len:256 (-) Transcript_92929:365-1132(-)
MSERLTVQCRLPGLLQESRDPGERIPRGIRILQLCELEDVRCPAVQFQLDLHTGLLAKCSHLLGIGAQRLVLIGMDEDGREVSDKVGAGQQRRDQRVGRWVVLEVLRRHHVVHLARHELPEGCKYIERRAQSDHAGDHIAAPLGAQGRPAVPADAPDPLRVEQEPWRQSNTSDWLRLSELRQPDKESKSQVPSCRVSGNCHGRARMLLGGPPPRGDCVVKACGEGILRGKPVVHGDYTCTCCHGKPAQQLGVSSG